MNDKNYRIVTRLYVALLVITGLGAAAGAIYYVNKYGSSETLKAYLDSVIQGMKSGAGSGAMLKEIGERAVLAGVIAVCSFVRPGIAVIAFAALRQGFIYGFTNGAFIKAYGINGVLTALARLPASAAVIIAIAAWGAFNSAISIRKFDKGKKFKIFYIIFFLSVITTFCAACAADVYLGTTFMKIIPIQVT